MALTMLPFADSEDDLWNASALMAALAQLLMAILFLFQTVVACLTLQVIKYFDLGNPCWYATYRNYFNSPPQADHLPPEVQEDGPFRYGPFRHFSRSGASSSSGPSANSNVYNGSVMLMRGLEAPLARLVSPQGGLFLRRRPRIEEDESGLTGLENRENDFSRSRSQDCRVPKGTSLVCPNCNAAWTAMRPLVFKDAKDILQGRTHWEDVLTGNKEVGSHLEGRAASPLSINEQMGNAGRGSLSAKAKEEKNASLRCQVSHELDSKVSCNEEMQSPAQKFALQVEEVVEDALNGKIEDSREQTGLDNAGIEARKLFSDIPESLRSKLTWGASSFTEVAEENSAIGMSETVESQDGLIETEIYLETEGDNGSSADVITGLRKALGLERKALCALYVELEEERNAAESAANEAIGMISRLQEEKAALQMKAAHYQRMAEEKLTYDEQAMDFLKEILYKRERENFVLEKEVKLFKGRFFREVSRATKRRKEIENPSLSFSGKEPMLLLEGFEEASVLKEHQEVSTADLESQLVEQKCTIPNGVGSGDNSLAKSSFRTEIMDEQPHKRLKGFLVHADESNGYGLQCLSDNARDLPFCTQESTNDFEKGCSASFPRGEQLEQSEQTTEMSASAGEEDETNIILNQLMDLEEQLHALGEADGFEPHDLAWFSENHIASADAMESAPSASVIKDHILVDSSPLDVSRIPSPERECMAMRWNKDGFGSMRDGFGNPPDMLECSDALPVNKGRNLDIDVTSSCPTHPREGAQMYAVNGINEVQLIEDVRHCSSHCEGDVITQDNINSLGKSHCLPYILHDAITIGNSGTINKDGTQVAPSSDSGPIYSSNVSSQHGTVADSLQCQSDGTEFISEDDKWKLTGKGWQEPNTRSQVLESEGVLQGHPSISLKPKDMGISLLKEVLQQWQELPKASNNNADLVEVSLSVPADSCFMCTSKTNTIIRKRHFLNGPGQT